MAILWLLGLFFFNDTATTEIYTLSLHDALPISLAVAVEAAGLSPDADEAKLRAHLEGVDVRLQGDRLLLDGRDVTEEIRTPRISELTSRLTRLATVRDRKSTRLNSSHDQISYAVFCLKKKKK